jgi:hypothetical protein
MPAEVVLAHRHCPSESHSHALPRTRLDATIGFLRGLRSHREDLPHDRQQPTHGAGTVVAGPAVAIVTRTGISLDEVQQALRVLTTSPSFFEVVSPTRPISSVVRPLRGHFKLLAHGHRQKEVIKAAKEETAASK